MLSWQWSLDLRRGWSCSFLNGLVILFGVWEDVEEMRDIFLGVLSILMIGGRYGVTSGLEARGVILDFKLWGFFLEF